MTDITPEAVANLRQRLKAINEMGDRIPAKLVAAAAREADSMIETLSRELESLRGAIAR